MKPPRRARWLVVALPAALALLCVIAGAFVWSRPRIPRTHHQNVRAALERRAIVYRGVELSQTYEESVEFDTYRAQVLVVMPDGRRVNGWLGCEDRDRVCFLELRGVGIVGERLPDISNAPPWPWVAWIEDALRRL
jgi:hypothetical protein